MAENRLHHTFEEHFVATEIIYVVACHAYHGTLDLWWWVEDALVDGEEILHVVPRLYHHAEDAVSLVARCGGDALSHLTLDHTRAAGDEILVVEHLEEDLGRDVVGIVAGKHKLFATEDLVQIHAQEVFPDDLVAQLGIAFVEVSHAFGVDFHSFHLPVFLHQVLCEDSHARSDLQNGQSRAGVYCVSDASCHAKVGEKVLTEVFLWLYLFHVADMYFSLVTNVRKTLGIDKKRDKELPSTHKKDRKQIAPFPVFYVFSLFYFKSIRLFTCPRPYGPLSEPVQKHLRKQQLPM